MTKLRFAAAFAAILACGSMANAAGLWPTLPTTNGPLTGNEYVPGDTNLPNGANPQTETIPVPALRAAQYQQSTPVTGFSIAILPGVSVVQVTPAGTLAAGTFVMPNTPVDGQRVKIFTTQTLTSFTLTAGTGQTINGTAVTTLAANASVEYVYQASSLTWFRIG